MKDIIYDELERRVCRLRYLSNWPLRRIAKATGVCISTVRNILIRGTKDRYALMKMPRRRRVRAIPLSDCFGV